MQCKSQKVIHGLKDYFVILKWLLLDGSFPKAAPLHRRLRPLLLAALDLWPMHLSRPLRLEQPHALNQLQCRMFQVPGTLASLPLPLKDFLKHQQDSFLDAHPTLDTWLPSLRRTMEATVDVTKQGKEE